MWHCGQADYHGGVTWAAQVQHYTDMLFLVEEVVHAALPWARLVVLGQATPCNLLAHKGRYTVSHSHAMLPGTERTFSERTDRPPLASTLVISGNSVNH